MFPPASPAPVGATMVNGVVLDDNAQTALYQRFGQRLPPGFFWYDRHCGAWGVQGGPAVGFTAVGVEIFAPLPANASGGGSGTTTGVFINGREIHPLDYMALQRLLGVILPGRYFVDAFGNAGFEGGPPVVNLLMLAQQGAGGGGGGYHRRTSSGYLGSNGSTSYFFDPSTGASVMSGGY